jgi:hypothetical protein
VETLASSVLLAVVFDLGDVGAEKGLLSWFTGIRLGAAAAGWIQY